MLGSLADLQNSDQSSDVVIVGGGAAGLTLAHALGASGKSVLLLEAGGDKKTSASQEYYRGELADAVVHPPTHNYRVRAIGGTSTIWGGRAIPFDAIDFQKRDWVPDSGWPFGREELAGFYATAMDAAEAGKPEFCPEHALPGAQKELAPGLDGDLVRTTVERFSKPTNFWRRYGDELTRSDGSGSSRTRRSSISSSMRTATRSTGSRSPRPTAAGPRSAAAPTCWRSAGSRPPVFCLPPTICGLPASAITATISAATT